ncbi:ABC-2 family transporter protein [Deinococcus deserti]|uniref:Putative ABC transporter, permease component n=1 Tax=Deinococcus deserti (strain DSM 17065 / CIP 109153 / LMG 22923 / VCD115) TaxID=546414 RepID=C1D1E3_DEIDV|nr:ABC-2 family transporter protein [Deinococcus deserti]ACO45667.1 putative ABC transporter, permease component [Deinococcus deserti VCD115]
MASYWTETRSLAGLYLRLLGAQARSQGAYRVSFALDALSAMLITAAEFAAFALVLPRFGAMTGQHGVAWTLGEVSLLYGLAELAFVLMDLLFGGFDAPNLSGHVRSGSFSTFLLRPAPLVLQVFGSDFALRRLTRVLLAAGIVAYGLSQVEVDWTAGHALMLLGSVVGMIAFFGGLFVIGGTLTFWTVDSVEAMNVLTYGGRTLISYPMDIYGTFLRKTFTYLIPAAFLSYFPVLSVLGRPLPDGLPVAAAFLAPLVGPALLAAAFAFWRFGVRHYQGTGT